MTENAGPLSGIRILDLSRVLAGPYCTQLLGDLGADVIKIEKPGVGDETRRWGPPYLKGKDGADTSESAYYLSCNRNKRSAAIDISRPEGSALVRRLLASCDVLIENFKVGGLKKYSLDYEGLKGDFPRLVYCSITGFGQTGPYAGFPGYDFIAQGMGGIMDVTGAADGPPTKTGVAIADIMCGMYASTAVLAALHRRDREGVGQYIDLSLLDTQVAWLANVGVNYLTSGEAPVRLGNAHPNIVPYQTFEASDGPFILAVGNDAQFRTFCGFAGRSELADDERFAVNAERVRRRRTLIPILEEIIRRRPRRHWLDGLTDLNVPCGPVNAVPEVFNDPQVIHREMAIAMTHPLAGNDAVNLIGNPIKLSGSKTNYRRPPPTLGEHTDEVLTELLGMDGDELAKLRAGGVI
ncbi:MAG: CoA-transferase [Rhodospirillales bacterium RIFCSPLOWO2_12_FULL_58_28]|nr:MAG: CoA-transferase [Rhodospirillales bacterium RIFCSPLOWO2_02_FULL_58_16]OHC78718.1 MAG: CoA-transferase [Rhodospirillales bacterium RIFCSPLOWO2_12_FULL_58_28]